MQCGRMCLVALLLLSVAARAQDTCDSDTDLFINRVVTIPQKPLNPLLIQRFQAPALEIRCLSIQEAGPAGTTSATCPTSPPILCSRLASDTLGTLSCETLSDYVSDFNAKIDRGDRSGPDMIWIIKWDPAAKSVNCFSRTLEIRLLAFARGEHVPSVALAVLFAIVVFIVVMMIVLAMIYFCRLRYMQMDQAGATTIGGPKMNYRGMQMHAAEPEANRNNLTRVILPVKQSGAIEDLNSKYEDAIRTSPRGTLIIDDEGEVSRGPNMVMPPRRASPPQPGDGINDPALQSRIQDARRRGMVGRRRGPPGINEMDEDDDGYGPDNFDRDGPLRAMDDPNGGDIVYDDYGQPMGRRPPRRRGGRRGGNNNNAESQLFPTQDGWSTMDGGTRGAPSARGYTDPYAEEFDEDDVDENGEPRRRMRGPQGFEGGNGNFVKFQPQWMHGSFGRGGVIPEFGDVDPSEMHHTSNNNRGPSTVHASNPNNHPRPAQRYRNPPPPTQQPQRGGSEAPRVPESPLHGGLGRNSQTPRSILKGKRRHQVGGASPMEENDEPVSFNNRPSIDRSNNPRGGSFGPSDTSRGGGGALGDSRINPNVYADPAKKGDSFQRGGAKMHDKAVPLEASQYESSNLPGGGGGAGGGSAPGSRRGSIPAGGAGGAGRGGGRGDGAFVCQDCGENVGGASGNVFCVATGKKHL